MNWLKILALVGLTLNSIGTVLLWLSSPSGYGLPFYGDAEILKAHSDNHKRMRFRQKIAITLIFLGAVMQAPSILLT